MEIIRKIARVEEATKKPVQEARSDYISALLRLERDRSVEGMNNLERSYQDYVDSRIPARKQLILVNSVKIDL